ncbi:MAG TPA: Uma2 family endonuclease, partial [Myxococcaceae bacterium]|nr:Uma2 family endonuclease [Myxococcaceae bacterium]
GPYDGAFTTVAPDWVCEVLSPSTSRVDRERKLPIFAREGVQHAWLIDPRRRTIDVHRLVRGTLMRVHTYREEPPPARIEPFEAVGLALGNLWIPSFSH